MVPLIEPCPCAQLLVAETTVMPSKTRAQIMAFFRYVLTHLTRSSAPAILKCRFDIFYLLSWEALDRLENYFQLEFREPEVSPPIYPRKGISLIETIQ